MTHDGYTRADALARAREAWDLRIIGTTWDDVAARLGYANDKNAMRAVREAFGEMPEPDRDEFRRLVTDRLEFWSREAMRTYSQATTVRERSAAIRAGVQTVTTLARVSGVLLDRPSTPTETALQAWVAHMLASQTPSWPQEADVVVVHGEIEAGDDSGAGT
jgi:hypothetical protein